MIKSDEDEFEGWWDNEGHYIKDLKALAHEAFKYARESQRQRLKESAQRIYKEILEKL